MTRPRSRVTQARRAGRSGANISMHIINDLEKLEKRLGAVRTLLSFKETLWAECALLKDEIEDAKKTRQQGAKDGTARGQALDLEVRDIIVFSGINTIS